MAASPAPSLTLALHRRAVFFFIALLLLAIPSFWPTYLFPPKVDPDYHVHLHGIAMFLWCALLIAQAWLIRTQRRELHRRLGKVSYALAPVIVVSTLLLAHYRLKQGPTAEDLYFFCVQVSLITLFVAAYSLAIRYRHTPALHARYMVCTALPLIDPIVARLLFNHVGIQPPWVQVATYLLTDVILLCLVLLERRQASGVRIFPAMLVAFVVLQAPTFFLPGTPGWRAFALWYIGLPLP